MNSSYSSYYLKKKKKREGEPNSDHDKSQEGNESSKETEKELESNHDEYCQKLSDKILKLPSKTRKESITIDLDITEEFYSTFINGNFNYYWKIKIPKNHKLENKSFKRSPYKDTNLQLVLNLADDLPNLIFTLEKRDVKTDMNIQDLSGDNQNINSEDNNDKTSKLETSDITCKSNLVKVTNDSNSLNIYNQFFTVTQRADLTYIIFTQRQDTFFKDIQRIDRRIDEREIKPELLKALENEDIFFLLELNISTKYIRNNNPELKFGYVGITNEGMTCYMNSLLQSLNILGAFKKAVFQIPTLNDDYDNSISLSLQRLFYDLLKDENPVSTGRLINSFGWGREEIQEQHDVQEFNLVLSEVMERKMKNTKVEGTFSNLFEGKLINYIHCLEVDYKRNIEEKFCDLQLTVKNCKNIYESLDKYIEEEILDNDDKYDAEGYGKQKAKKGIKFKEFPKVFILQLKRFEYIPSQDRMMKINDFFQYPEELDLSKYILDDNNMENCIYSLHSVVVHKGSINSGHYYAFIKPTMEDSWIKFNDEVVRPAAKSEAFENNFGGVFSNYTLLERDIYENKSTNDSNAYILIYIQNSARYSILQPLKIETDIPEYLMERFEVEKKREKKAHFAKIRRQKNLDICLISNETIKGFDRYGIINNFLDWDIEAPFKEKKERRFLISFPYLATVGELFRFISTGIQAPVKDIRLFILNLKSYENYLKRFNIEMQEIVEEDSTNKTILSLCQMIEDKNLTLFVYSNNNTIFDQTTIYEEECILEDNEEKNIFISKKLNKWNFASNIRNFMDIENAIEEKAMKIQTEEGNKFIDEKKKNLSKSIEKLICFKFFRIKENNSICPIVDSIILCKPNKTLQQLAEELNLFDKYDEYLNEELIKLKSSAKMNFLQEFSTLNKDKLDFSSENFYYQTVQNPLECVGLLQAKFIIITLNLTFPEDISEKNSRSLEELFMENKADELFNEIYLRTNYVKNSKHMLNEEKQRFSLEFNEKTVRSIICQKIKVNNELVQIIEDIPYYDHKKTSFNLENFQGLFNPDCIEIIKEIKENQHYIVSSTNSFYINYSKRYPLTTLINQKDYSIRYKVNVFTQPDFIKKSFSLFDSDNNFISKICVALPKNIRKCTDVINYLYDPILKNYYPDTPKEDFYFILQSPNKITALDIFIDLSTDLYMHKDKTKIIYRIQPYSREEIHEFDQKKKNYIAFLSKDNNFISFPIIIFISANERISSLRKILNEKIRKINILNNLDIPLNKYKIYTCMYYDYFPRKNEYISPNRDDDSIASLHRNDIHNILVEIPINIENRHKLFICK